MGTRLLDEVATAQQYINHLVGMGVNKIVLLTHVGLQQVYACVRMSAAVTKTTFRVQLAHLGFRQENLN